MDITRLSCQLFSWHLASYPYPTHYAPFITRSETCDFVREEDVPITPSSTLLSLIRPVIPFIDMHDGMYERNAEWAMTSLEPTEDRDVALLDFKLLQNCKEGDISIF